MVTIWIVTVISEQNFFCFVSRNSLVAYSLSFINFHIDLCIRDGSRTNKNRQDSLQEDMIHLFVISFLRYNILQLTKLKS